MDDKLLEHALDPGVEVHGEHHCNDGAEAETESADDNGPVERRQVDDECGERRVQVGHEQPKVCVCVWGGGGGGGRKGVSE